MQEMRDSSFVTASVRWMHLAWRLARLWQEGAASTPALVRGSYDRIASAYDRAWTHHMRELSVEMLDRGSVLCGGCCVDLTCGTGFVAGELLRRGAGAVIGVDASAGMIAVAKSNCQQGEFVQSDILEYLRKQPGESFDVMTCAWGLGYSRPAEVVRECARVLRPGGRLAVIDNSIWSLREMVWTSMRVFAQHPQALDHVMRVRFLRGSGQLADLMRKAGLTVGWTADGERRFVAESGRAAIERLVATGAAAGFEMAAKAQWRERVFADFARYLDEKYRGEIPIIHRYLAGIGSKGAL